MNWALSLVGVLLLAVAATSSPEARTQSLPNTPRSTLVLIDEAHNNFHTSSGGYAAYARLLRQSGFTVAPLAGAVTADALAGAGVLITASPQSEPRVASRSAFAPEEISMIQSWVRDGGSLLLVLDHAPTGAAGAELAAVFDVEVRNAFATDSDFRGPTNLLGRPGHFLFRLPDGVAGDHPILAGLDNVVTYTGGSLQPPRRASTLLRLPDSAVDRILDNSAQQTGTVSAAGLAQAVAMEHGRGRVVVLGEAGMLTTDPGSDRDTCGYRGIADSKIGNGRFALNIVRWLAHLNTEATAPVTFANTGCIPLPLLTFVITGSPDGHPSFAGRWQAQLTGMQMPMAIDLVIEGAKLSGTLINGVQRLSLYDGVVDEKNVRFKIDSPEGHRTITFKGTVGPNEIVFTREVQIRPGGTPGGTGVFGAYGVSEFVATRGEF